jgi:polyisoprenoid-binding protein YceI
VAQGALTIRDVTREVALPFELTIGPHPDAAGQLQARASGELAIARLDYGVGQGDFASTRTVGDEVVIRIAIDATRPR